MEKVTYTFKSGTHVTATVDELNTIAKALGETLDYSKFSARPKGYYPSESSGLIKISEMNDYHVRRALLKVTKEFFSKVVVSGDSNDQFLTRYLGAENDPLIYELFVELTNRK
jgi:hypothetical protein